MRMTDLDFILGEKKLIEFEITSLKGETVVVASAEWSLTKQGEDVDRGECTVDGKTLEILLEPGEIGTYELTITYKIAPEVRKARCIVNVC